MRGQREQELAVAAAAPRFAPSAAHNVTVVSPPDSSTAGGATIASPTRNLPALSCKAIAACTAATSRASPSMRSLSTIGAMPRASAASAAAASACCGLAISANRVRANTGSPGFGVSSRAASRCARTAAGRSMRYLASTARASAKARRVGDGRPRGDHGRVVPRHVGNRQGQRPAPEKRRRRAGRP